MFLGYYSQYTLEDLADMDVDTWHYLMGAMLDCTHPESTEPERERISRLMREKAMAAHQRHRGRRVI